MNRIQEKIKTLERNYKYSARKYAYYSRLVTIPSIVITSLSSIFSFLSSSNMVNEEGKKYSIVTVAILTSLATMFQTISSSCEFEVKKTKFVEATQQFNMLSDKVFFEIQNPNESNFVDKIEEEIEKIKNQCKFVALEAKESKEQSINYHTFDDQTENLV